MRQQTMRRRNEKRNWKKDLKLFEFWDCYVICSYTRFLSLHFYFDVENKKIIVFPSNKVVIILRRPIGQFLFISNFNSIPTKQPQIIFVATQSKHFTAVSINEKFSFFIRSNKIIWNWLQCWCWCWFGFFSIFKNFFFLVISAGYFFKLCD